MFPMLSALSRFMNKNGRWELTVPKRFSWKTFYEQPLPQYNTAARFNPQTMGKTSEIYVALHGSVDMFFAVTS